MENKMRLVSLTVLLTLLVGACAGTSNSGAPADSAVAGTPTVTPVVPLDDYLAYTVSIKTGEKTSERRVRLLSFRACRENASACTAEEIPSPAGVDPKQWFMLHWSEDGKLLYWDYSTASDQGKVSITRYSYNPETRTSQKEETAPSYVYYPAPNGSRTAWIDDDGMLHIGTPADAGKPQTGSTPGSDGTPASGDEMTVPPPKSGKFSLSFSSHGLPSVSPWSPDGSKLIVEVSRPDQYFIPKGTIVESSSSLIAGARPYCETIGLVDVAAKNFAEISGSTKDCQDFVAWVDDSHLLVTPGDKVYSVFFQMLGGKRLWLSEPASGLYMRALKGETRLLTESGRYFSGSPEFNRQKTHFIWQMYASRPVVRDDRGLSDSQAFNYVLRLHKLSGVDPDMKAGGTVDLNDGTTTSATDSRFVNDGAQIFAKVRNNASKTSALVVYNLDGTSKQLSPQGADVTSYWLIPDKMQVVVLVGGGMSKSPGSLTLCDFQGSAKQLSPQDVNISFLTGSSLSGKWVAAQTADKQVVIYGVDGGSTILPLGKDETFEGIYWRP